MRWPFVSRSFNDFVIDQLNEERRENLRLCEQIGVLVQHMMALKAQGATIPDPTPTLDRKQPDPVIEAITAKAGSDRRLRAIMSREAMAARRLGVDDIEIIQQIEQGVTADEDGIPA